MRKLFFLTLAVSIVFIWIYDTKLHPEKYQDAVVIAANVNNSDDEQEEEAQHDLLTTSSDDKVVEIPFYYDPSNGPHNLSKTDVLAAIEQASNGWMDQCGVAFKYKGNHVNGNTSTNDIGIIKWSNTSEEGAISEARLGSIHGPARGFVLSLNTNFFSGNGQKPLVQTIAHGMGHVIGLDHSSNERSIMYPVSSLQQRLLPTDVNMCQYLRARWTGISAGEASQTYNITVGE
jgi:hypothetical protein